MNVRYLSPVRRLVKLGYQLEIAMMMVVRKPMMKKMNARFDAIERSLNILLSGHKLLAADKALKAQEADEKNTTKA